MKLHRMCSNVAPGGWGSYREGTLTVRCAAKGRSFRSGRWDDLGNTVIKLMPVWKWSQIRKKERWKWVKALRKNTWNAQWASSLVYMSWRLQRTIKNKQFCELHNHPSPLWQWGAALGSCCPHTSTSWTFHWWNVHQPLTWKDYN